MSTQQLQHQKLKVEAEKVAREVLCTYIVDKANLAIPSDLGIDAILNFAKRVAARERLEGQIEVMEGAIEFLNNTSFVHAYRRSVEKVRIKLATLEKE